MVYLGRRTAQRNPLAQRSAGAHRLQAGKEAPGRAEAGRAGQGRRTGSVACDAPTAPVSDTPAQRGACRGAPVRGGAWLPWRGTAWGR